MNNGLLLGLGALVVGGGIAWLAFRDEKDDNPPSFIPINPNNVNAFAPINSQREGTTTPNGSILLNFEPI